MASFNSNAWGITLEDAVKEYKRRQEEWFPNLIAMMEEVRNNYRVARPEERSGIDNIESLLNRIMAESIEDMEHARDFFNRSLEWDRYSDVPYVIEQGVI